MEIKPTLINFDDLPDHIHANINKYIKKIFTAIGGECKDKESLNYVMAALSWVSFLTIKCFIADHDQQKAVVLQAKSILKNLEHFKDRDFVKESMMKNEQKEG